MPRGVLVATIAAACAMPAWAGPPYETDDPEPTAPGHWEIYNFTQLDGPGRDVGGIAGLDLNYGGAKSLCGLEL